MRALGRALLDNGKSRLHALKCDAFELKAEVTSLDLAGKRLSPSASLLLSAVVRVHRSLTEVRIAALPGPLAPARSMHLARDSAVAL